MRPFIFQPFNFYAAFISIFPRTHKIFISIQIFLALIIIASNKSFCLLSACWYYMPASFLTSEWDKQKQFRMATDNKSFSYCGFFLFWEIFSRDRWKRIFYALNFRYIMTNEIRFLVHWQLVPFFLMSTLRYFYLFLWWKKGFLSFIMS